LIEYGAGGQITKSAVDELVYKDADFRIYQMTGAVARRDFSTFAEICFDLLSKGYDENAAIASLLNYFKNLLTVLRAAMPDKELAAALKMSDYVYGKTRQQAQAIGEDRLIGYINALYSLAADLKSGRMTAGGALESALANVFFA
ncbi:MAG: hypothetical protein K2K04_06365, partial [Clostridia bacterium]|nr:hypothetical protein [Clostridia bacterium]